MSTPGSFMRNMVNLTRTFFPAGTYSTEVIGSWQNLFSMHAVTPPKHEDIHLYHVEIKADKL